MTPKTATEISLKAGCKVNLFLDIVGVRDDGYHELDSLFYPLSAPHDILHLQEGSASGMTFECAHSQIDPRNNTVTKAYAAFAAATSFSPSLNVRLEKGIPQGAGLGGGSADAGVLLRHLNTIAPTPLSETALMRVAASVGADVPFFLYNRPCHVTGIGEQLTPCSLPLDGLYLLLLCPSLQISTPWAYAAWDAHTAKGGQQAENAGERLTIPHGGAREWDFCYMRLFNAFEAVVFPQYPLLRELKEQLLREGAAAVVMSGSGASLVALFRKFREASAASELLRQQGLCVVMQAL